MISGNATTRRVSATAKGGHTTAAIIKPAQPAGRAAPFGLIAIDRLPGAGSLEAGCISETPG